MKKEKKQKVHEESSIEKEDSNESHHEIENLKLQLARALADYDNLRKRVEREREDSKYLSKLIVISRLLPVFDMFEDAQKHTGDAGLGIAIKVLHETLKDEGVEEVRVAVNDEFNPELHEAVDTVESEDKDNIIESVALKGYKFVNGPLIRPAKVKVYKKKS